ncbi:MAG: succinate dehydrogenase, hydrophobic membrane anchor protein [Legionellaceae bacterium]|nr:succinate dehydrogenase, hydrophobic membrane anchor protein [Legionellaceae bacterium]
MLPNVTSLTGNGLKDWLIQRVSAVYLFGYLLFISGFLLLNMPLDFYKWHDLFYLASMQIATILAMFFLMLHAWIGLWTVTTDYINKTSVRLSVQVLIAIFLGSQFLWGLMIIWGQ